MDLLKNVLVDAQSLAYLFNLALAASLLTSAGLVTAHVCRGRGAPLRHGILLGTLALILLSPGAIWLGQNSGLSLLSITLSGQSASVDAAPQASRSDGQSGDGSTFSPGMSSTVPGTEQALSLPHGADRLMDSTAAGMAFSDDGPAIDRSSNRLSATNLTSPPGWQVVGTLLAYMWVLGVIAGSLRLAWNFRALNRFCATLETVAEPRVKRLAQEAARAVSLQNLPPIFTSASAEAPLCLGIIKPAVVIPEEIVWDLDDEQFHDVLIHEMAHVARRDPGVGLAARIGVLLFWWNPLVYRLRDEIAEVREDICDNFVCRAGGSGSRFAETLVAIATRAMSHRMPPAAVGIVSPCGLTGRVMRLLSSDRILSTRMTRLSRWTVAICALSGLLFTALAGGLKIAHSEPSARTENATAAVDSGPNTADQQAPIQVALGSEAEAKTALDAGEIERRITAMYDRVSSAIVRVRWQNGDGRISGSCTGAIVTTDGHVLLRDVPANVKLTFDLPDGRHTTGSALGWSKEWGIGLAKLDGSGPWPHVELGGSAGVKSGQCVVRLGYSVPERLDIVPRPLLGVDSVNRSANGWWFMTADARPARWQDFGVVFDLSGHLVGVETFANQEFGSVYTDAKLIESLWDGLFAGKNLDQVRLTGRANVPEPNGRDPLAKVTISRETQEKARAATVQIRRRADLKGLSGVIVTENGVVATCAHIFMMPGTKVIVSLPDGRDVAGEVAGISFPADVGLVRITEPGPFPHVEMGDSTRLHPGDPCLAIGYGPVDIKAREPSLRTASVVEPPDGRWSFELYTNAKMAGGDSGGGLFDAEGRLVAIHCGLFPSVTHRRVELFHKHLDELRAPLDQTDASGLASAETDIQRAAEWVSRSVVEVLDGDKPVALGTIVSADGRIITKASVLPRTPACRFPDGRVLSSIVLKTVREHDLAVLKVDATNLAVIEWSGPVDPPMGALVAVVAGKEQPVIGSISHPIVTFPSEHGWVRATLKDSKTGLEVTELHEMPEGSPFATFGPQLLRKGDIVQSIDGQPTPNHKAYLALLETENNNPIAIAGDLVRLAVIREGKPMELPHVLGPPTRPRLAGQSARCSGFSRVYNVAATSKSSLCGGPVTDRNGRVIGVAIAWRHAGWLLVLPTETARNVAAN